jgi:hypothetical protein
VATKGVPKEAVKRVVVVIAMERGKEKEKSEERTTNLSNFHQT